MRNSFFGVLILALAASLLSAQSPAPAPAAQIILPAPAVTGGMTLNEAIATRRTTRTFSTAMLSANEESQLLWSAQGITDNKGHRAAPSGGGKYYLHVYVARADGFFEYMPANHSLQVLSKKDVRASLSLQPPVKAAAEVFIVAAEYDRARKDYPTRGVRLADLEAGHATQNVLLQAAALGLNAIPVGGTEPKLISDAASLPAGITPIYLIPLGHPKP